MMKIFKRVWYHGCEPFVYRQSILTSFLVGTALLFLNRGNILMRRGLTKAFLVKGVITYLVPFLVSTFTAVRTQLRLEPEDTVPESGLYRCEKCLYSGEDHLISLDEDQKVPPCPQFGEETVYSLYDDAD